MSGTAPDDPAITEPVFPPLFEGYAMSGQADPFDAACAKAALGCDAGLVMHNVQADRLRAAIVFAPEVPLGEAMVMQPLCGIGFQNALGALAPPELAVQLTWEGGIVVNGAACGHLSVAASTDDPAQVPDWLVVGLSLPLLAMGDMPGHEPEKTTLVEEGCGEVEPVLLLEAWVRHSLVWLNRWSDEGVAPLHREWSGLVHGIGASASRGGHEGVFLGTDEAFGMLLRDSATTHLIPLTTLLEDPTR
ncbi:biotin/lipoate--protein ligase family protein [Profundibacterium mesophilum]|uniref:Biotin-(Acetyl-CoA carboxylase) ligase n=1 Tax=Profundibacterium mesophilum KAUST100406-0324 TaxID=1037889 RepID=A0A921NQI2_9RHOB|nr:biotin/lipoate--protein ligase family protein [Profundibacterium mesophilum]KAF0676956.1 hypothetical protein PMES_00753 [Profundibacterium mesophilum KAUST100406-0324]